MATSRSLERRVAFTLACITALLAIALAMWFISTVRAEPLASRSFYDGQGRFAGSSVTRGKSTSFYGPNGRFAGSALQLGRSTNFYDSQGRNAGSALDRR